MIELKRRNFAHKLGYSYDEFLQVLIEGFTLDKLPNGNCIKLELHDNDSCLKNPKNKSELEDELKKNMPMYTKQKLKIQEELDNFSSNKKILSYHFDCSKYPLRYANGGVLPIMKINSNDYFCLFYRTIFPIGWNIANGASNNLTDLLDPRRVISREFSEEFVIMDHTKKILYLFNCDDSKTMLGTQSLALKLWAKKINNEEITKYKKMPIPLKWIEGPDRIQIKYNLSLIHI